MSSRNFKKRWLVALIAASSISGNVACSDSPEPLQRLGRFVGAGWGDGYHACETSGFRPIANLPPRSYYQQFEQCSGHTSGGCLPGNAYGNAIETLYGREKSCDRAGCDSLSCDSLSCDSLSCDSLGCDSVGCDSVGCDSVGCDAMSMFPTTHAPTSMDANSSWNEAWASETMPDATLEYNDLQPQSAPRSILEATSDTTESRIEELPDPQPNAEQTPAPKPLKRIEPSQSSPSDIPGKPSDVPGSLDSSGLLPRVGSFAVDLHESQMRPIRPLPPQPKRELSYPERPQSPQDASELTLPRQFPSPDVPKSNGLPASGSGQMAADTLLLNQAIQMNPFVQMDTPRTDSGLQATRAGQTTLEPATPEPSHRVAEVPDWLIVKQPR